MWGNLLIVILVEADLFEPMTLVETLCVIVRHLNMEVDRRDLGFGVGCGIIDEILEALRSDTSRAIRLRGRTNMGIELQRMDTRRNGEVELTARTARVMRYSFVSPSFVSILQHIVPIGMSL